MRILLSGSHGTGKSTTLLGAKSFLEEKGFEIFDSISAKFFKPEDFKDPEKLVSKQLAFTQFQCDLFTEDKIASSRSYADIWAYSKHLYERDGLPEYKASMDLITVKALAAKNDPIETQYVFFPIAFDLKSVEGKELRSTNLDFQKEIQSNILEFFKIIKVKPYEMKEVTVDGRIEEFKCLLK